MSQKKQYTSFKPSNVINRKKKHRFKLRFKLNWNVFYKIYKPTLFISLILALSGFFYINFSMESFYKLIYQGYDEKILMENLGAQTCEFALSKLIIDNGQSHKKLYVSQKDLDLKNFTSEFIYILQKNDSLYGVLSSFNQNPEKIATILKSTRKLYDLKKIIPGHQLYLGFALDKKLTYLKYEIDFDKYLVVNISDSMIDSTLKTLEYKEDYEVFESTIMDNLYSTASNINMDYSLVGQLADIFAYDISFNKELRKGDSFRLLVQKRVYENGAEKYGRILAAQFMNQQKLYEAYYYDNKSFAGGYYNENGQSLRKMFIRSPVPFSRVSSRFSKARFHPVLKVWKPHYGVDFAAATGTPVKAVGSGTVVYADWKGANGKMVKIRHNSTYSSAYCHLSRYGKGIRSGVKVKQGQIIGYVGSTGRSTGPHCHLAFYKNGKYVDFLTMRFHSAEPISKNYISDFRKSKSNYLKLLDSHKPLKLAKSSEELSSIAN
ncbi:MAG: peptidoglycan DD-metalloendopeptidase family protein [Pseudomonadota bacterium]